VGFVISHMISRLVPNGLEPLCLLLTHLSDIDIFFCGDVYKIIASICCLIAVCYVRCLKGGDNPLGNGQFQVSLCNIQNVMLDFLWYYCLNNYQHCFFTIYLK